MTSKTFTRCAAALAIATMLAGAAVTAQANPMNHGGYRGHGGGYASQVYNELKPEQQIKYDAIFKAFQDSMSPLTEKMMAKRLELDTLSGNPNADPKRITALSEDIASLRTQMWAERVKLDEKLQKEVGISAFRGVRDGRDGPNDRGMGREYRDDRREGRSYHGGRHGGNCGFGSNCTF